MSKRYSLPFAILMVVFHFFDPIAVVGQSKRWDGEAGDSLWSNALNWDDNSLPVAASDVLLDNSLFPQGYVVKLSAGTAGVTLRSLVIMPSTPHSISFVIPADNKAVPALSTTASPGIQLGRGAALINASGAASGNAVAVSDSLRILNEGRFIQRSETAHATLLARLAQSPGTEKGIFEFDVPSGSSYTVSISNRVYGTVLFSAAAAGGQKNYLSSGSSPLLVRGDCFVGAGATWSLNYSGVCTLMGNTGISGTWNLSSGIYSNSVKLLGDFDCSGKVTESGTGMPLLEWAGNAMQHITLTGGLLNSVGIQVNNPSGVVLHSPLTVKSKWILSKGIVYTSTDNLLVLDTGCIIKADSLASNVFIHGPLCLKGILPQQQVYFPVGKGNSQRWLSLREVAGNITVEFFKDDPANLSSIKGEGLSHISSIEYWKITAAQSIQGNIELSFDQVNSGGVTDLSALRVATLLSGKWENMGNTAVTGSAGASGSVLSQGTAPIGPQGNYYTLASSIAGVNTLPDVRIDLHFMPLRNEMYIEGQVRANRLFTRWQIESMYSNTEVKAIHEVKDRKGIDHFNFRYLPPAGKKVVYRACASNEGQAAICGKWVTHEAKAAAIFSLQVFPNPASDRLWMNFNFLHSGSLLVELIGTDGRKYIEYRMQASLGVQTVDLDLINIKRGSYWLRCMLNGHSVGGKWVVVK